MAENTDNVGGGVREADLQKMVEEMVGRALEAQRAERTRVQLTPGRTFKLRVL